VIANAVRHSGRQPDIEAISVLQKFSRHDADF